MTQEEKEKQLLLKDLSARLPYGVILNCCNFVGEKLYTIDSNGLVNNDYDLEEVKPCLFPLSSMTEEQWNNAPRVNLTDFTFESLKCGCFTIASYTCDNDLYNLVEFINWLIENHFDIYGLIPKNLAIDCTNLNIY